MMPWLFTYSEVSPMAISTFLRKEKLLCVLPASLPDHRLVFKGRSRRWGGAIASVEKSPSSIVYGSALLLAPEDILLLRKEFAAYRKKVSKIILEITGDSVPAVMYVLDPNSEEAKPSEPYKTAILRHLRCFWKLEKENEYLSPKIAEEKTSDPVPNQSPPSTDITNTSEIPSNASAEQGSPLPRIEDIPDQLDTPEKRTIKKPRGKRTAGKKKATKGSK